MILRLRLSHLLVSLFFLASFTAAWPWPPSLREGINEFLMIRQDGGNSASSNTTNTASAKATDKPSKTATPASGTAKGTAAATTGSNASGTQSGKSAAATTGAAAQTTNVDPRLPQGGVNMVTPSALASTTYYKIGDNVTFAWNYTSLSVTPSKIDVLVTCSANSATYTLTNNASFASTGSVVWDTFPDETGTAPLLTETYALLVHDAAKDVSAVASAGHLGSYNQFQFGMYIKQSYTPRTEWKCAVCSAAMSDTERQALKFMSGMAIITVLSFTWFVGGFGAML